MAYFRRGRKSSYSTTIASRGASSGAPAKEYVPVVDKNPHYRTTDIFNRIYKKKIRLEQGTCNKTDCNTTIWVKFGDPVPRQIVEDLGVKDDRTRYLLECGHEWSGKNAFPTGKDLPCMRCGGLQSYLGMEHEWQHIIFKSNPVAEKLFLDAWVKDLLQQSPHVDEEQLRGFLHLMINAFDDIRCNSLWEKVYPGSADKIWQRWKRLVGLKGEKEINENFIAFMFATALGIPTDDQGPYAGTKDTIDWGMQNVRYKGFGNMLSIARTSLDRCLGALLAKIPPRQQPPQTQQPQQSQQQGQQAQGDQDDGGGTDDQDGDAQRDQDQGGQQGGAGDDVPDDGDERGGAQEDTGQGGGDASSSSPGQGRTDLPLQVAPSASQVSAGEGERSDALSSLIRYAEPVDEDEEHHQPTPFDMMKVPQSTVAMVAKALQNDPDPASVDPSVDQDMQDALAQLHQSTMQIAPDSQLLADAKAKVLFIDVLPTAVDSDARIELSDLERQAVERMRAIFFRTMGKQKAMRSASGTNIDIDAAIQYAIEPSDPEIFQLQENNQGFAYLVLVDMSGSMMGSPFGQVSHAAEMLKKSLRFPFVDGRLWGFRGGELIGKRAEEAGEVWIYRYDKGCEGYLGTAPVRLGSSVYRFPVNCGGLTPMHSAVRVAVRYLLTQLPSGMAKQLFILTDGSPVGTKTTGRSLPAWILRDFVAKEVKWARQRGISVQSLIIGSELDDDWCRAMFGPTKFWTRATTNTSSPHSIDRSLQQLVIQNFQRYLKTRG